MKLLRKRDVPDEKYTNAFLGFGPEDTNFALELTYSMFTELPKVLWHSFSNMPHMFAVVHMYQPDKKDTFISSYELTYSFPGKAFQFCVTSTVLKSSPLFNRLWC
jgi:hypothetical protein